VGKAEFACFFYFDFGVGSPMGGAVPTQPVQRVVTQVADWLPEHMYICNQPKTETALNVAFLPPRYLCVWACV
jgi:hypothetical protein